MKKSIKTFIIFMAIIIAMPLFLTGCSFGSQPTEYDITLTSDNRYCSTMGTGTYTYGESIIIAAIPASGYTFDKWSDGNDNAVRKITITEDANYTAYFKKQIRFDYAKIYCSRASLSNGTTFWLEEFKLSFNSTLIAGESSYGATEKIDSFESRDGWHKFYATGNYLFEENQTVSLKLDFLVRLLGSSGLIDIASANSQTITFTLNDDMVLYPGQSLKIYRYQYMKNGGYNLEDDNFTISVDLYFK